MTTRLSDLEMAAWQSLLHAHLKLVRILEAELQEEHGLAFGDYDVLVRLARADGRSLRMSDLARGVMIPPSRVTRVVERLERGGLVRRSRDAEDARVVFARLTDAGLATARRASRTHLRGIRRHFSGRLSPDQLRDVASALSVFTGQQEPR